MHCRLSVLGLQRGLDGTGAGAQGPRGSLGGVSCIMRQRALTCGTRSPAPAGWATKEAAGQRPCRSRSPEGPGAMGTPRTLPSTMRATHSANPTSPLRFLLCPRAKARRPRSPLQVQVTIEHAYTRIPTPPLSLPPGVLPPLPSPSRSPARSWPCWGRAHLAIPTFHLHSPLTRPKGVLSGTPQAPSVPLLPACGFTGQPKARRRGL